MAKLFVGAAQFARGIAAAALDAATLGGDVLEFAVDPVELALGIAAALRDRRRDRKREQRDHRKRAGEDARGWHQAGGIGLSGPVLSNSRLSPLISAGFGSPSRSS